MDHLLSILPLFVRTWWVELLCALLIVVIVPLIAGYIALGDRKALANEQQGPGPLSPLQSIAGSIKLLLKEDLIPDGADPYISWIAPVMAMSAALIAMGAIAFGPWFQVGRDINIGLLFAVGVAALVPFGVLLSGSDSTDSYSIIGALQGTAQLISFETAAGLRRRQRPIARRNAEGQRHRPAATRGPRVVCLSRASCIFHLFRSLDCGNRSRAFRAPRTRASGRRG